MGNFNLLSKVDKRNITSYSSDGLNALPLRIGHFNELVDRLNALFETLVSATNIEFVGSINLTRNLTHYIDWIADSSAEVLLESNPVIGGSAEIRMIGDGTHTPLFAAFTKSSGSADFDPTLNAINKVVFYYDGTNAFYSITIL